MYINQQSQLTFTLQEFSDILDTDHSTLEDFLENAKADGSTKLIYDDYLSHAMGLLDDSHKEAVKTQKLADWEAFEYDCLCYFNQWGRIIGSLTNSFFESKPGPERDAMKECIKKVHEDFKDFIDWHLHCLSFAAAI
jgi:hypothetical protein